MRASMTPPPGMRELIRQLHLTTTDPRVHALVSEMCAQTHVYALHQSRKEIFEELLVLGVDQSVLMSALNKIAGRKETA